MTSNDTFCDSYAELKIRHLSRRFNVKDVRGGTIRLDNGQTIYVSETFEELKKLIEGGGKENKEE